VALHVLTDALPAVVLTAVPPEVCLAAELQQSAGSQCFGVVGLKEHQTGLVVVLVVVVVVELAALEPAAAVAAAAAAVLVQDQP
jgi:hypothetical protein